MSKTPRTDAHIEERIGEGSLGADYDFARQLERELDAALALVVAKDMALREARKALLERNGLDRDADRKAAVAINMALTTIIPKT